jgi:hypothetical protein
MFRTIIIVGGLFLSAVCAGCSDDKAKRTAEDNGGFLKDPCTSLDQWKDYEGTFPNMDSGDALQDSDMNNSLNDKWLEERSKAD